MCCVVTSSSPGTTATTVTSWHSADSTSFSCCSSSSAASILRGSAHLRLSALGRPSQQAQGARSSEGRQVRGEGGAAQGPDWPRCCPWVSECLARTPCARLPLTPPLPTPVGPIPGWLVSQSSSGCLAVEERHLSPAPPGSGQSLQGVSPCGRGHGLGVKPQQARTRSRCGPRPLSRPHSRSLQGGQLVLAQLVFRQLLGRGADFGLFGYCQRQRRLLGGC